MIARRDRDRETRFIAGASPKAGRRYLEGTAVRLEDGQHLYGDTWAAVPFEHLIRELKEEALDLGCWAALADQRLSMMRLSPAEVRHRRDALRAAVRAGAEAFEHLSRLDGKGAESGCA